MNRLNKTARALAALASQNLLNDNDLIDSVGTLVRRASESNHWHNCADYRSRAAADFIATHHIKTAAAYQKFCRSNLRHEHVVPNRVIIDLLRELTHPTEENIENLLKKFCIRATITLAEDVVLRENGLASRMPEEFYQLGHTLYQDPLARYKKTGLFQSLEKRTQDVWFK